MIPVERMVVGFAVLVSLVLSALKLSLQFHPTAPPPGHPPGPDSPLLILLDDAPPTSRQLSAHRLPGHLTAGEVTQADRIAVLLRQENPLLQLWTLESVCWMHTLDPQAGLRLAREAIANSSAPRAQVTGAAALGCQVDREAAVAELARLLEGDRGEVAAVAAAIELARLDATEQARAVGALSERVEDEGLAILVAYSAWCLGAEDARFSAVQRPGL